jgi:DNA repair protein RecO (recombination protein O)
MSRTFKTEGIILKRTNFGEADRILTVYTKHYGKIKALAKGVRKLTSRKGGNVELFNWVTMFLARGKNFDILTEVSTVNSFKAWRRDLKKVGLAYYFCELVDKLTPEGQANSTVFRLLGQFLGRINSEYGLKLVRDFEEALLDELGFGVPEVLKKSPGSLKSYIESVVEREIKSPKVIRDLS